MAAQRTSAADYRDTVLAIQERIEVHDLDGAGALLSAARKKYPADGGIENLLGVMEIQRGNATAARHAFDAAIDHSPRLVGAYLNLARLDIQTSPREAQPDAEALRLYQRVLVLDPGNVEASVEAATLYMAAGEFERSRARLLALPSNLQQGNRVKLMLCADELATGHPEAAEPRAAEIGRTADLEEDDVLLVLPALRAAHRADLIDAWLRTVATRTPLSPRGLRVLGLAQEAEGRTDQAKVTLERVYAADPASVSALIDLARIAITGKQYEEALGYLAHARELAPTDPSLPYEFGVVCFKMNLLGESRKAMADTLKLAPDNPEYLLAMGTVSSLADDPLQAMPYLKRYHALRPQDPGTALLIGAIYTRVKDYDAAVPWLTQATKFPSTRAQAHFYLGSSSRQQGRYEEALAELQKADALKPDQADVLAEIGQLYLQLKKYPDAEAALHKALTLDPESYPGNFGLLQFYARTADPRRESQARRFDQVKGRNEQAYREAMRVIEIHPEAQFATNR